MNREKQEDVSKESLAQKIDEDMREFLARGGKVQQIETGKSGSPVLKPNKSQLRLGNSK